VRNIGEKGLPVVGGMYKHDAPLKPRNHPSCTFASDEVPSTSVLNIILNCKKSRQGEQKRRKARTHQIFVVNAQKVRHIGIRYLVVFITRFAMKPMKPCKNFGGVMCIVTMHSAERRSYAPTQAVGMTRLKLLHGSNVGALDVVLEALDLLLELVEGDLVVLDDQVDLELLDAEADGNELGATPDETVLLNATDSLLELLHGGLVICEFVSIVLLGEVQCDSTYPRA
jgi:hypothetical protein